MLRNSALHKSTLTLTLPFFRSVDGWVGASKAVNVTEICHFRNFRNYVRSLVAVRSGQLVLIRA